MISAKGEAIFPGEVSAPCTDLDPRSNHVLICESLTVEIARKAIQAGVAAVVSETGNFASHAANLLRAASRTGVHVVWVRGLSVRNAVHVDIDFDGTCRFRGPGVQALAKVTQDPDLFKFNLAHNAWHSVCLWPDRTYSDRELRVMLPGLMDCATNLSGTPIVCTQDSRGRIWFSSGALDSNQLEKLACDPLLSQQRLAAMVVEYDEIQREIANRSRPIELIARRFFSNFLVFHRTYAAALRAAGGNRTINGESIVELALQSKVVTWLYQLPEFQDTRKRIDDPSWQGLLPPHNASWYVNDLIDELVRALPDQQKEFDVSWLAHIAVVKEMKFILAKNIFALVPSA